MQTYRTRGVSIVRLFCGGRTKGDAELIISDLAAAFSGATTAAGSKGYQVETPLSVVRPPAQTTGGFNAPTS